MSALQLQTSLKNWFLENQRSLPWRQTKDPYLIWISEVMLQQTTVQAVVPYFLRFKAQFPSVEKLAEAPLEEVLSYWAGLGYYSRARNLHKAAQQIAQLNGFPKTYQELLHLPGFGEYTARAVSSIAYEEPVGVVDGNVIRILSRVYGLALPWWQTKERAKLQKLADELVQGEKPSLMNQAMMELGATICTPTSPACTVCPWLGQCKASKQKLIGTLPLKKEKQINELIEVEFKIMTCRGQIALVESTELPFLKKSMLPPLKSKKIKIKPKKFHFQHAITKYKIFVNVKKIAMTSKDPKLNWYPIKDVARVNPSSLLKKALHY